MAKVIWVHVMYQSCQFEPKTKIIQALHCSEPFTVCELSLDEFRQVDHRVYSGYVQVEY